MKISTAGYVGTAASSGSTARPEGLPPIGQPESQKRMDAHFYISELADFVRSAGWEMAETTIIDVSQDGRSERRICLLDAV